MAAIGKEGKGRRRARTTAMLFRPVIKVPIWSKFLSTCTRRRADLSGCWVWPVPRTARVPGIRTSSMLSSASSLPSPSAQPEKHEPRCCHVCISHASAKQALRAMHVCGDAQSGRFHFFRGCAPRNGSASATALGPPQAASGRGEGLPPWSRIWRTPRQRPCARHRSSLQLAPRPFACLAPPSPIAPAPQLPSEPPVPLPSISCPRRTIFCPKNRPRLSRTPSRTPGQAQ